MSDFIDAFDAPVIFKENGLDLSFPKLDIDDHVVWCAELHATWKPEELKAIPGNASPVDRFKMQRFVEHNKPTLDSIADLIYTPTGTRECMRRSMAKAGKSAEEVDSLLKKIPPGRMQKLAIVISGLFDLTPAPANAGTGATNPLAQPPASGAAPSTSTGSGHDSSSADASTNPSAA